MSTSIDTTVLRRELAFGVGAFVGMATLAFGIATLVLAMSVGLRRSQGYLPDSTKTALIVVGAVLVVGGILARLYRNKISERHESKVATSGAVVALVGAALALFGLAAETTVSAPFLASPREKVVLFGIAYVLIAVGLVTLRLTARVVGW